MNNLWEAVQPHVQTIIISLIGIIATVVLSLLAVLQKRVNLWIASKTSVSDRELIHRVASEAFALAEKAFKETNGQAKLNYAFSYTSEHLAKAGIKVTADEIKAAIEKAVLDYNAKTKAP